MAPASSILQSIPHVTAVFSPTDFPTARDSSPTSRQDMLLAYHSLAFVFALLVLERGADTFLDHTVVVAKRTGVPAGLLALLTAGAEWEELAVVIIAISSHRPALAIGNIVGSAISNILGAFSIGLLFGARPSFDHSSRTYSLLLLPITLAAILLYLFAAPRVAGVLLVVAFAAYLASIAWSISRGRLDAPELSDSDDSDSDSEDGGMDSDDEERRLLNGEPRPVRAIPKPLFYHVAYLLAGLLAIVASSYVLTTASSAIVDATGLSEAFFGVVILSIATTLPEKFIAVMSASRGQTNVMVASTVGSNIFLLTLCLGVTFLSGQDVGTVKRSELGILAASTIALTATVWLGANRSKAIGILMLLAYAACIIVECLNSRSL